MKRSSSTRLRLEPRPPILISSRALDSPAVVVTSRLLRLELRGRPEDRLHDVLVAGAAAQVAGDRPPHVFLGRVGVAVEQLLGRHHHARRAEPALQPVLLPEPFLDRVQLAGRSQALHRGDLAPVDLHRQHRAGLDGPAVDQHCAGPAVGRVAAAVGAGQPGAPADQVGQQQPGLDLGDFPGAVEGELDLAHRYLVDRVAGVIEHHRHDQAALSVACAAAVVPPRMRVTKTRTSWRLYSAVPRWSVRGWAALAARSAASAMLAPVSGPPVRTAGASVAPMVDPPTPVSAMPARTTSAPEVSIETATPTVAKSP